MPVKGSVNIQIVWTGPNGSANSSSDLKMESPSRYISQVVFDSIESTNSGEYICTIHTGQQATLSAKKTLTVGEHMPLQHA